MNIKLLSMLLVCLILTLSILDAPEYINCVHIGLCEFLELSASIEILQPDIERHISYTTRNIFYSVLENYINITDKENSINNLNISYIPAIINSSKISFDFTKIQNGITAKQRATAVFDEESLDKRSILSVVKTSVIRSWYINRKTVHSLSLKKQIRFI